MLHYERVINLDETTNAHSLGILSVPPGRVLDIGPGGGHIVAALRDRGCEVWAVEVDPAAARAAEPYCERVLVGNVEEVDLIGEFRDLRFDSILFLDVLEHLKDPSRVLRTATHLLSDEGRVVASIPNVAHAAVRLSLLRGRFEYRESGLLDRTHLRFFDRDGVNELFEQAGLSIEANLRVRVRLTETELDIDPSDFPHEAIQLATADPDADTYQFVVVARPGARRSVTSGATLLERLQRERDELQEAIEQGSEAFERQLAVEQDDRDALRRDVAVKDAYIAELRSDIAGKDAYITELQRVVAGKEAHIAELSGRVHLPVDDEVGATSARLRVEARLSSTAAKYPALAGMKPLYRAFRRPVLWLERVGSRK